MTLQIYSTYKRVWQHPRLLQQKKKTFSQTSVPMEYRNENFCETKRLMHYLLGQNLLNLLNNPFRLNAYNLATRMVNLEAFIKEMIREKEVVTIKDYMLTKRKKEAKDLLNESIQIVSVHFKVNKSQKSISIPENVSLTKKPKRTRYHIARLQKFNFHIQSSIA